MLIVAAKARLAITTRGPRVGMSVLFLRPCELPPQLQALREEARTFLEAFSSRWSCPQRAREAQHAQLDTLLDISAAFQALAHATDEHRSAVERMLERIERNGRG